MLRIAFSFLCLILFCAAGRAEDSAAQKADRAAVEGAGGGKQAAPVNPQNAAGETAGAAVLDFDAGGGLDLYVKDYVIGATPQPLSEYWIGIDGAPVDDALRSQLELPEGLGLVLNQVVAGSAAEKAGLKQYDVLISCNDVPLKEIGDLAKIIEARKDSPLALRLARGGKRLTVEVTPQKRPASETGVTCPAISKAEDVEFIRRAYLDLLGTPPEPRDVESFLAGKQPDKRKTLVDWLLSKSTVETKSCRACHADDTAGQALYRDLLSHVLVFKYPERAAHHSYIKRLVGLPGMFVQIDSDDPASALPDDVSVSITYKKGEAARATIKQKEKTWEVTVADFREKLPEELRGCVEALLAPTAGAAVTSSPNGIEIGLHVTAGEKATQSEKPAGAESAFEQLDKQFDSLASQLGGLRKAMQELRESMRKK